MKSEFQIYRTDVFPDHYRLYFRWEKDGGVTHVTSKMLKENAHPEEVAAALFDMSKRLPDFGRAIEEKAK